MQELKERIIKEGKVLPGNIVKVDGFLNHRIDCKLMADIADEFAKLFDLSKVDLILTAEASGIALAAICAYRYGLPMVFAKKAKSDNIEGGLYQSEIYSYTYKKKVTQILSKAWASRLKRASRAAATGCATWASTTTHWPSSKRPTKTALSSERIDFLHFIPACLSGAPGFLKFCMLVGTPTDLRAVSCYTDTRTKETEWF